MLITCRRVFKCSLIIILYINCVAEKRATSLQFHNQKSRGWMGRSEDLLQSLSHNRRWSMDDLQVWIAGPSFLKEPSSAYGYSLWPIRTNSVRYLLLNQNTFACLAPLHCLGIVVAKSVNLVDNLAVSSESEEWGCSYFHELIHVHQIQKYYYTHLAKMSTLRSSSSTYKKGDFGIRVTS